MTKKEALIISIMKYNWSAKNPCKAMPNKYRDCALCKESAGIDCELCVMFSRWPNHKGFSEECDDEGAWDLWIDEDTATNTKQNNPYDKTFFALILVEAFCIRLVELYREEK